MRHMIPAALLVLAGALWLHAKDRPAAAPVTAAVFELRPCFDPEKVARVREIDRELKAFADAGTKRVPQNPDEREKLKAQYIELYNKRKHELYVKVDEVVGEIGREKGYTLILKKDQIPSLGSTEDTLTAKFERRTLFYSDPQVDITAEVLRRLNAALAPKEKKDF